MQFMLADRGFRVISADRGARGTPVDLSDLYDFQLQRSAAARRKRGLRGRLSPYLDMRLRDVLSLFPSRRHRPKEGDATTPRPAILFYQCDLTDMRELADDSVDAVVSVSALEHNEPAKLRELMTEMARVAKSGATLLHTVSATREGSAFHQPSGSWLLDEVGLAAAYGLREPESNFERYDELFGALLSPRYLARWLHIGYSRTGDSGMPWGAWEPRYMPVGIRIIN